MRSARVFGTGLATSPHYQPGFEAMGAASLGAWSGYQTLVRDTGDSHCDACAGTWPFESCVYEWPRPGGLFPRGAVRFVLPDLHPLEPRRRQSFLLRGQTLLRLVERRLMPCRSTES